MEQDRPKAGQTDDPRALALARARQERLVRQASYYKPVPAWENLTNQQRTARIKAAAEWVGDAYQADLLSYEYQPAPSATQFAAIEAFLTARQDELDAAGRRDGTVVPYAVRQAATMVRDRIRENLILVRVALHGAPDADLSPSWSPRSRGAWADTLRCADQFKHHADYAPATWIS
ncbi:hypothetical protein [Streptomyces scopuliridis]|uniref:hypothetical protein n=1 Tax=Streptomyces scopuliridis TaxID=452529 RepID=UPI0034255629